MFYMVDGIKIKAFMFLKLSSIDHLQSTYLNHRLIHMVFQLRLSEKAVQGKDHITPFLPVTFLPAIISNY